MTLSVLDVFSIGIGPSSSHTVGPMRATVRFLTEEIGSRLPEVNRVRVELHGSLGATGIGHHSDRAVLLGLEGENPETVDTTGAEARVDAIRGQGRIRLAGEHEIPWAPDDLVLSFQALPFHANAMTCEAFTADGERLAHAVYYSIGGGFIIREDEADEGVNPADVADVPYPFSTGDELLAHCAQSGLSVAEVAMANENAMRPEEETRAALLHIWQVMQDCTAVGLTRTGTLPGGLRVPRRAAGIVQGLRAGAAEDDPLRILDWVNLWSLAVNEENASGGRVVTAPTNGAAGIIPAVLHYYTRMVPGSSEEGVIQFLLAAGAICAIVKKNASISGAEMGCQGEVGSACGMAAAGLTAALGGDPKQVENAAEIGIEHNLGLTCDPVGGLVQIPCIERNAVASVKAITASRLALHGDGEHVVTLDTVIRTLRDTGHDMQTKYKETSLGGLAVNVTEC